jgi:Zn-dependent protease
VNFSLYDISVWVLPLLIAITFHEAAHAFVAYRLGDNTAGSSAGSASIPSSISIRLGP